MQDAKTYASQFSGIENMLKTESPAWVHDIRKAAIGRFSELGFPTTKNEQWRFTRVRPLLQHEFSFSTQYEPNGMDVGELERMTFPDGDCDRLVFVNGLFAAGPSNVGDVPTGVKIGSIREGLVSQADLFQRHLTQYIAPGTNPFAELNTAHLLDGAFVHVADGVSAERPIHLVFVSDSDDKATIAHPRNLIVAEKNSAVTVLESYVSKNGTTYFNNAATEIFVGEGASVNHSKLQKESHNAFHVATLQAQLSQNSRFDTKSITLGGSLVRNDINVVLDGEGIECILDGLYVGNNHQHIDNHTNLDHAKPRCDSHELYKGLLSGHAKAVFNGKIHVHPDAQKTDAKQSNRCMLLSDDAQINTNPQLEIYADDVKCTHGAAVGQIDEDSVFYLRSRGIREADARHMLIHAFANEVIERIPIETVRDRLESDLFEWLSNAQA